MPRLKLQPSKRCVLVTPLSLFGGVWLVVGEVIGEACGGVDD